MYGELIEFILKGIDVYILIFSRLAGMMISLPFFSRNNFPVTLKAGFTAIISYVILPFFYDKVNVDVSFFEFIFIILGEFTTGILIGIIASFMFYIFLSAGANADINMGLSMAEMFDPSTNISMTLTGRLLDIFAYLIFFIINGHHLLVKVMVNSFEILPINSVNLGNPSLLKFLGNVFTYSFTMAFIIVLPIMITLFLSNILLGFMAKVMPQMNVFIVGMPFKIICGFVIISISMRTFLNLFIDVFKQMFEYIYIFMKLI